MSIATAIPGLSPLGVFETASSLIAIAAGFVWLARHAAISTATLSCNPRASRRMD